MISLKKTLLCSCSLLLVAGFAQARSFDIPGGSLEQALDAYTAQTGVDLVVPTSQLKGVRTNGVNGDLADDTALTRLLSGTGFIARHHPGGAIGISRDTQSLNESALPSIELAQAVSAPRSSVETVTVTSSKLGGADVQSVPIAITAMSQEQLTATQTAGGPDLVKNVPNLTFSKTNFTGYNIQIRGIGTQAISVTTDPAVAISFDDVPFLRNHFFEQEFFDVSQVEVLRGPQGTLYGRNATSGVVNLISAKPTDHWEAMASVDVGNYNNRRLEGMLNIPVLDDKIDLRIAGEWTKRDGYSFNEQTDKSIDGRDLWSGRVSLLVHPIQNLTATFVWEHFQEDDDRERSTKQLCQKDPGPSVVDGPAGDIVPDYENNYGAIFLSQGCKPTSLYSPTAFQTPNAAATPFIAALYTFTGYIPANSDPYGGVNQNPDLRVTDSAIDPIYTAKNDTYEFNVDYNVTPELTLTSQTAYNQDHLYSTEDYNRFNTAPGFFTDVAGTGTGQTLIGKDGEFCDPQLGCSTRLVGQDVSREHAHQFYQEVRLSSNFEGPLNFVAGGNYLKYSTLEDYFVFANVITLTTEDFNSSFGGGTPPPDNADHIPFDPTFANSCGPEPAGPQALADAVFIGLGCSYIDPNPLGQINGNGHNYFRSQNPYRLTSWAGFGEVYYQVTPDVKLTGGLRFTDDSKSFDEYPSWTLIVGQGYPSTGTIDQEWKEVTGRLNATWTPKLDFTDQSLFYASYAHGYKGGGANPPGVIPVELDGGIFVTSPGNQTHPLTFKPEYNDAFELGSKNTLLDGTMTVNGDVFLYKYRNYQISQIVDRTSVNLNFDATVKGAEIESTWEPIPGLRFNLSGGYENATLDSGSKAIDLMDRTAGNTDWLVVKPYVTETSNCILPKYVVNELLDQQLIGFGCVAAYTPGFSVPGQLVDPVTWSTYVANPAGYPGYVGFDPTTAPNNGEGFEKDISGNQLPNTPHFTISLGAQYSMPLSDVWAGTLRGDFYWQSDSFARVFNDRPYDQLEGYTNLNFALIFTNQDGWQAMAYVKNVLDTTAITGAFLNSDDSGLTTNVFVTDPRLFGIRITKNW
ncbi:MAG TPA: TonB-dependent receptor [Rhizomicrobium sp.]|nr:TonB-dependent receptor [Rhizomicrobium sp.]